ncbi:sigma-54 interaction domain-containing protein [Desulfosediminicola ganghwensis]|uniref:sigma-54 interaction domain-containing protein n=1 Tax=Desulfosediminicola ganghwensis TaxID=2569540 RepID=UPI0010AD98D6|nr:sigma 54-interacting transcriptional regulator [Desulfosediminicola ganghwensis]
MAVLFTPDYLTMLEGIPYPAMILNDRSRIQAMNRLMQAITGYAIENVRGVHGELVVRSNAGNTRGQNYNKVLQTGEPMSVTGDILNRFRRKIPTLYHISRIKDAQQSLGLLVIVEDTTGRASEGDAVENNYASQELIGHSPQMQKVFDMIPLMSQTDASVLITGETGTGKDKIAELIHAESSRARYPFIKVNCGALPTDLLESELFGHVKGAFTGATRNKQGMFKLADRGTLFLTEIGDMPLPLQVKLLSVLDDSKFIPVGGEQSVEVDVRIIAATHRPLREQVKRNEFREDLFYRLNVLHVHLPSLRERQSDIRYLLDHFLQKFNKALGKNIVGFTPLASQILSAYAFPGNVRELRNIVEYAVNVCKRKKISDQNLPPYIFDKQLIVSEMVTTEPESVPDSKAQVKAAVALEPAIGITDGSSGNGNESWGDIERQMIVDALLTNGGNRTTTSEQLGWGRMKLWRKMKKYGLL